MFDQNAPNKLTAKLPGDLQAYIFRDENALSTDEPIYAINWFDTKTQWVYDFYNFLAVKAVKKIGGGPFFKGKRLKTLYGEENGQRDVLLVVRYPALENFRTMLENKYFQLVSVLRMAAVKDFTFGISKRSDDGTDFRPMEKAENKTASYAVHHFSGSDNISAELRDLALNTSVEIFLTSDIKAHIGTGKTSESCTLVECILKHIVILRASEDDDIIRFVNAAPYQDLIKRTERSFIGLYNRIL